jgi:transposase
MMSKKHHVVLSGGEREQLLDRIHRGGGSAQDLAHARILLKADEGAEGPGWKHKQIVAALDVSLPTVERVRKRFAMEGLALAVGRRPACAHKPRKRR